MPVKKVHIASTNPTRMGPRAGPKTARWRGSRPTPNARNMSAKSVVNSIVNALRTETWLVSK